MLNYSLCEFSNTGKRWYISYYAFNPATNRKERVRIFYNRGSESNRKRMAAREMEQINSKLESGWSPFITERDKLQRTTCIEAISFALKFKLASIREASKKNYRQRIGILTEWLTVNNKKDLAINDFDAITAQTFMDDLLKKREIIGKTFNNYLIDYRMFFNFLRKRKFCTENPFQEVEMLKEEEKQKIPFNAIQRKRYAEYCRTNNYHFYITSMLCYYCGLRPKEMTMLQVKDINMQKHLIIVPPGISKNGKTRIIKVAEVFWKELYYWIKNEPGYNHLVSTGFRPGRIKIQSNSIAKQFRKIATELKFPKQVQFYSLKDTCADVLSEAGISIKTIRDLFGHSSIAVTDKYMRSFNSKAFDHLAEVFPLFDDDESDTINLKVVNT